MTNSEKNSSNPVQPVASQAQEGEISSYETNAEAFYNEKPREEQIESEVFGQTADGVDFRTVHWIQASVIFLKTIFATGVLAIPSSLYILGAVPGAITVVIWAVVNTYCAIVLGDFRQKHPSCHSVADMAFVMGGPIAKEIVGILFLFAYVICAASGVVGASVGLNALSNHAVCTNWFSLIALVAIAGIAGIRKFEKLAWVTWAGSISVFVGIFIVVVGVTLRDRPAAAPQTGDFELGFHAINHPSFSGAVVAVTNIFCASAANSAFIPVISEMKNPRDYKKAVIVAMSLVSACYLSFSLVLYAWCGKWIASPSLGSGGDTLKKAAYGVAMIGLLVSAGLWAHIGAKYLFVRILRNSEHLQKNSVIHWSWWAACVVGLCVCSFLIASGVPIFEFIIALAGSVAFAPLALVLPGLCWLYIHPEYFGRGVWKTLCFGFHVLLILVGIFITVGGTHGVVEQIILAYRSRRIGEAFSCADNSNSS